MASPGRLISPGHHMTNSHRDVCSRAVALLVERSTTASQQVVTKNPAARRDFSLMLVTGQMHMPVFFFFSGSIANFNHFDSKM